MFKIESNSNEINQKWFVLHNPSSGGWKGERDWPKIHQLLKDFNFSFVSKKTDYKAHALELVKKALQQNYKKFIVIGGDGSLNETVNAIISFGNQKAEDCVIGYLPVGTGNDWAKSMKIPVNNYKQSLQIILNNKILRQDVGVVNCQNNGKPLQRYFLNIASIGFGGAVSKRLENLRSKGVKTGKLAYLISVLRGMFNYKAQQLNFNFNNQVKDSKLYFGAVAICKFFGGGMQPAPHAHPADNLFELTIVDKLNPYQVIRSMSNFYKGKIEQYKQVNFYKTNLLEVSNTLTPLLIETDGEFIGETPARFSLLANKINVIINNDDFL